MGSKVSILVNILCHGGICHERGLQHLAPRRGQRRMSWRDALWGHTVLLLIKVAHPRQVLLSRLSLYLVPLNSTFHIVCLIETSITGKYTSYLYLYVDFIFVIQNRAGDHHSIFDILYVYELKYKTWSRNLEYSVHGKMKMSYLVVSQLSNMNSLKSTVCNFVDGRSIQDRDGGTQAEIR